MGRWIKRIVLGLAGLVVLVLGAAATFVLTFDAADYKQEIAGAFAAATGRQLHFGGRIESRILTLQPAITLHDASLLNPPGFSRPALASAKRVHLILRLRPLLQRRLAIIRLEVEGGDVLFEMNEKGERNWRQKAETPPAPTAVRPPANIPGGKIGASQPIAGLTVDRLLLKNVKIAYLHGPTRLESSAQLDAVTVAIPAVDKPITLAMDATYQGAKVHTEGTVGSLGDLLAPRAGANFPLALKIAFGRSRLDIDLKADLTAKIPTAEGRITAKQIDLDELNPPSGRGGAPGDGRLFSAQPLPLGILNAFDARGAISIEQLILRRQRFAGVAAKIVLKGGDLAATSLGFTLAGARVSGEVRINAASAIPAVSVRATGSGVRLREVTQVLFERATMSSNMTFTLDVNGRGRSMREIAAGLTGPVVVALGPGPINAGVLDFLSKDIFSIHRADQLSLVCALARFDFARGTGSSRRIVIDTTRATAYGSGWVSRASETLDITLAPTTKGKSLASVAAIVPVRVHGPIVKPNATPDVTRTPEEVAKSVLGVVELPAEIVSSLFGRASQATRTAGCGGAAPTSPTASSGQKEQPGLLERGGNVIKKLNPFQ
ncbi:MAG TPA: AsmA family protein [Alphaproteobacteria bacterium]